MEVLFYRLGSSTLEATVTTFAERTLARGARMAVRGTGAARLDILDAHLWSFRDDAFLPHGQAGGPHDAEQPVLLTTKAEVPNGATTLILCDGARVETGELDGFERVALIFDGNDDEATRIAREDWKRVSETGHTAVFWAEEEGRWVEKARSGS
ncbi:DNA polymerase III subunit chi [Roseobacter sp. HKCCA0434]|uniref:DNA polymerase III subunit chi n=1 Tax=Roseobacter sp. HKCCA0434 TaxID=3079297 RepID=UPI002905B6EB|nr:DNA polymerase III subunit chi [Roseobacter sp. HKCCA0434]